MKKIITLFLSIICLACSAQAPDTVMNTVTFQNNKAILTQTAITTRTLTPVQALKRAMADSTSLTNQKKMLVKQAKIINQKLARADSLLIIIRANQ